MALKRLNSGIGYTPIGSLSHRVTIQVQDDENPDELGGIDSYVPVATVWAKITALKGKELAQAQQMSEESTHLVIIRYFPGLTAQMTLLYEGRFFKIESVMDPDERKVEQHLLCWERNIGAAGV